MKRLQFFSCTLMFVVGMAGTASATPIQNIFGLASPTNTITFDSLGLVDGTLITNQYTGVSFSFGFSQTSTDFGVPHISGGYIQNYNPSLSPDSSFSILFTDVQTSAAFTMNSFLQDASFTAYLNGTSVESFAVTITGPSMPNNFYGFEGILFDEIFVDVANGVLFDNLQLNPVSVPEPGTLGLLGIGLFGLALRRRRRL